MEMFVLLLRIMIKKNIVVLKKKNIKNLMIIDLIIIVIDVKFIVNCYVLFNFNVYVYNIF